MHFWSPDYCSIEVNWLSHGDQHAYFSNKPLVAALNSASFAPSQNFGYSKEYHRPFRVRSRVFSWDSRANWSTISRELWLIWVIQDNYENMKMEHITLTFRRAYWEIPLALCLMQRSRNIIMRYFLNFVTS